jgi:hypothetical protein
MIFAAVHESGIGTSETSNDVRYAAAFGGNADISQWVARQSRFLVHIASRRWDVRAAGAAIESCRFHLA